MEQKVQTVPICVLPGHVYSLPHCQYPPVEWAGRYNLGSYFSKQSPNLAHLLACVTFILGIVPTVNIDKWMMTCVQPYGLPW